MHIQISKEISYKYTESGTFSFICRDEEIIKEFTDRKGVVLKIFWTPLTGNVVFYRWGRKFSVQTGSGVRDESSNLIDSVKIQNIFAMEGLAPFVYDVKTMAYKGDIYPVLICEDVGVTLETDKDTLKTVYSKIKEVKEKYGFKNEFFDTGFTSNVINGKFIDFQAWHLPEKFVDTVKNEYEENVKWAGNVYESVPELNIIGYRGPERFGIKAEIDKYVNFRGKRVLDIGCSGGEWTRYALKRDSTTVTAVDLPSVIKGTFMVNNYLGFFDVDYRPLEMKRELDYDFGKQDIVFFMSVQRYFGLPKYLFNAETVIYEHNGDEPVEKILEVMVQYFNQVINLGVTGKNDDRQTFIFIK